MTLSLVQLEQAHLGFYVPSYRILVNGKDLLRQLFLEITQVQVDNTIQGADRFSFTVNSAFNFENREFLLNKNFPLINDVFAFGSAVEIRLGYQDNKELPLMLRGKVTSVQTSFPSGGLPQITVSGYDLSYCMTKGKKSRNWSDKTDSFIVSQIAQKDYGLNPQVQDTVVQHPKTEQSQESDSQFLEKLAERNGYEISVFDRDLIFKPPPKKEEEAKVSLEWGKGLLSFTPEINIAEQITKVEVRGWDVATKKEIVGTATAGDEPNRDANRRSGGEVLKQVCRDQGELKVRKPVFSQQEAKRMAEAILKKRAELFVQGSGESIGIPEIRANTNIELLGMGKEFSKKYYVEQATHTISTSGYRTTFKIKDPTI
jgi:phage protein D